MIALFVLLVVVINYWFFETSTYLITYTIDLEGKRIIDSIEYTKKAPDGIPSINEIRKYVESQLVDATNLRIIDVHTLK